MDSAVFIYVVVEVLIILFVAEYRFETVDVK